MNQLPDVMVHGTWYPPQKKKK